MLSHVALFPNLYGNEKERNTQKNVFIQFLYIRIFDVDDKHRSACTSIAAN